MNKLDITAFLVLTEDNLLDVQLILVNGLGDDWKMFARLLKVTDNEIRTAEQENVNNVKEQIYAVIQIRFDKHPDTKWDDLKYALKKLKKNELIEEIENFLSSSEKNDEESTEKDSQISQLCIIISNHIVSDWKGIVRQLGLPEEEINIILKNHNDDVKEQAYQALRRLKEMKKKFEWADIKPFIKQTVAKEIERDMQENNLLSSEYITSTQYGNCNHSTEFPSHGFGIIAHLEDDKIKLLEKLFDNFDPFSNFTEKIVVYRGGNKNSLLSPKEWLEEARDYYYRFFKNKDFFAFNEKNEDLTIGFKSYLKKRKPAFLIQDYNLFKHYEALDAVNCIPVENSNQINFHQQYIAFELKNNALYFIQYSEAKTLNELKNDIDACISSIQMFILLHKDMVKNSALCIVSLVVIDDSSKHLCSEISLLCPACGTFIMTSKKFKKFDIANEHIGMAVYETTGHIKRNGNIKKYDDWKYGIGNILTFLAKEDSDLLPNLSDDTSAQIDEAKKVLLLSPQQIAIRNSKENHILLQGSHGSGKSVVGRFFLKDLVKTQRLSEMIYYINYGGSHLLTKDMKCFIEKFERNTNIICIDHSDLLYRNVSEILQYLLDINTNVNLIHVIFEELPIDEMTEKETMEVIELLKNEKYEESFILFLCQSMVKERHLNTTSADFNYTFSDQVKLLQSKSSMVVKTLYQSARTTVAIDKLVQSAVEVLEKKSNKFFSNVLNYLILPVKTTDTVQNFEPITTSVVLPQSSTKDNNTATEISQQELSKDDVEDITENQISRYATKIKKVSNLDRSFHSIGRFSDQVDGPLSVLESRFKYHKSTSLLHNITGPKPTVFMLNDFLNYAENWKCCTVMSILENIYKTQSNDYESQIGHYENVMVLYFAAYPPSYIKKALKLYAYRHCIEIEKYYSFQSIIDVRGMEYKNVIVYMDVDEYHMRHYLIEAITRCKCNLFFIVVENRKYDSVLLFEEIINTWKEKDFISFHTSEKLSCSSEEMHSIEQDLRHITDLKENYFSPQQVAVESREEILNYMKNNLIPYKSVNDSQVIDQDDINSVDNKSETTTTKDLSLETVNGSTGPNVSKSEFPSYKMDSKPRGKCLVFYSTNYTGSSYGILHDSLNIHRIKSIFQWLQFEVEFFHDFTYDEISVKLDEESKNSCLEKHDCFIVFFLNEKKNVTQDLENSYLTTWFNMFHDSNCLYLHGKPKLFFVYKEKTEQSLHLEARDSFVGVFYHIAFLQRFCERLEREAGNSDFMTIFNEVTFSLQEFDNRLLPSAYSTMTKLLYFFPSQPWESYHVTDVTNIFANAGDILQRSEETFEKIRQGLQNFQQ